jgi:hypothetical protein
MVESRACALMTVLLFVGNSAGSWGGATTDGVSGTNAQRQRPPRLDVTGSYGINLKSE